MDKGYFVASEYLADVFVALFKAVQVELFVFLDERVDDVSLSASPKLLSQRAVYVHAVFFVA